MNNAEIAGVFQDISDLLEIKGENKFKVRATRGPPAPSKTCPKTSR
jgi:DNA polymerase/3'-5' exonuclease PolX